MSKYLDKDGLGTLWDRIKSYVASSITSYKTSTRGDDKYVPNGTSVDLTLDNVGLSTTNNLLSSGTHYVALRASNSNPFFGLKLGTNLWYAQAANNYFYFGPTSSKALRLDLSGNGVFQTGSVTATSIIKSGGTSSLFLKADGSVDSNTYLTSFTETDPVFTASAAYGITSTDITNWNNKVSELNTYVINVTTTDVADTTTYDFGSTTYTEIFNAANSGKIVELHLTLVDDQDNVLGKINFTLITMISVYLTFGLTSAVLNIESITITLGPNANDGVEAVLFQVTSEIVTSTEKTTWNGLETRVLTLENVVGDINTILQTVNTGSSS